jgi:hypothetical protein
MKLEIGPDPKLSRKGNSLLFLAGALIAGTVVGIATLVCENHISSVSNAHLNTFASALSLLEALVSLFVIAATIQVANQHAGRRLFLAGFAVIITPLILIVSLTLGAVGGHDPAAFGALYFTGACWISGFSLLVVATVRHISRRKNQGSV